MSDYRDAYYGDIERMKLENELRAMTVDRDRWKNLAETLGQVVQLRREIAALKGEE